jgi:hypothetical protein
MGFGSIPGSSQTPAQTRDALQTLTGVSRLDAGAIKNLPSGGLSTWQTKTSNYTAVAGDRIRAQLSVANLIIKCPISPNVGDEIEIQRLDITANSLIIDTNGQPIKGQTGKDGLFNNGNIGLAEKISYVNGTIGWLPQHDRLTYQTHVTPPGPDPYYSNVTFLLRATSSGHSDLKGAALSNFNTAISTTAQFSHSVELNSSSIGIPNPANLISPTGDWTIEFWFRSISSGFYGMIFALDGLDYPLGIYYGPGTGTQILTAVGTNTSWYTNTLYGGTPSTTQSDYYGVRRIGGNIESWKNGVLITSAAVSASLPIGTPPSGPGNFATIGFGSNYCNGYYEEFRITNGIARDLSVVPAAQFSTT